MSCSMRQQLVWLHTAPHGCPRLSGEPHDLRASPHSSGQQLGSVCMLQSAAGHHSCSLLCSVFPMQWQHGTAAHCSAHSTDDCTQLWRRAHSHGAPSHRSVQQQWSSSWQLAAAHIICFHRCAVLACVQWQRITATHSSNHGTVQQHTACMA